MTRNQIIQKLHNAKRSHLAWVGRAELLTQGHEIQKEQIPVLHTDCAFGDWYFGDGQVLNALSEFQAIDAPHKHLHDAYASVFKLITDEENASAFSRLLGIAKRKKEADQPVIHQHMNNLEQASNTVISSLEALEHRLHEMSDEEFEKLVSGH
ncbi:MAG: CZB domain-containing protein [Pseudomonadota bacterium]